jgi:hypothetical protein
MAQEFWLLARREGGANADIILMRTCSLKCPLDGDFHERMSALKLEIIQEGQQAIRGFEAVRLSF